MRSKEEGGKEGGREDGRRQGMKGERRKYNRIRLSTYWLDVDDHIVLEVHLLNV